MIRIKLYNGFDIFKNVVIGARLVKRYALIKASLKADTFLRYG